MAKAPSKQRRGKGDKHLTGQFVELALPQRAEQQAQAPQVTPAERVVDTLHSSFGNSFVSDSIAGTEASGLHGIANQALQLGLSGIDAQQLTPGTAPLSIMRELIAAFEGEQQPVTDEQLLLERIGKRRGAPLPDPVRLRMERAFGHELGHVRVHTDGSAAEAALAAQARAFAVGQHIYFGPGEWQPGTPEGQRLLAHELAHVVQADQGRLPSAGGPGVQVSSPNDAHEIEADAMARLVVERLEHQVELEPADAVGAALWPDRAAASPDAEGGPAVERALMREAAGPGLEELEEEDEDKQAGTKGASSDEQQEQDEQDEEEQEQEDQQDELALDEAEQQGEQTDQVAQPSGVQDDEQSEATGDGSGVAGGGGGGSFDVGELPDTPQLDAPLEFSPQPDSVGAYMAQHGPASNPQADAADSLLDAAWNVTTDALGPLVAYDRNNDGFEFENLWGVSKQVDAIFEAANADRGDSFLDNLAETSNTLAQAAASIGSVSGAISTTTGLLSLIGLIPPLAPVGAALLSVSGLFGQIALYSGLAATIFAEITTVITAVQLVEAVQSGAPDAQELMAQYQADITTFVGNGIGTALDVVFAGFQKSKGIGDTFENNVNAGALLVESSQAGGSTGRSLAYQANNMVGDAVAWNVKGTATDFYQQATKDILSDTVGDATADWAAASALDIGKDFVKGGREELQQMAVDSDAGSQQGLPVPEHSPVELQQIGQTRQEISQALGHVQSVGDEGQMAVDGGQLLLETAQDQQTQVGELQSNLSTQQSGLEGMAEQAAEGKTQAEQGQGSAGNLSGEASGLQSQAESTQAQANQPVPTVQKPKGLLEKAKAWFMEKVVAKVKAGMAWVQGLIGDLILKVVAQVMGVDDIEAKMAEAGLSMLSAQDQVAAAQASSEQAGGGLDAMQTQADTASTDAQSAISQGEETVAQSTDLEAQLQAKDAELQAQEDEISAYIDSYLQQAQEQRAGAGGGPAPDTPTPASEPGAPDQGAQDQQDQDQSAKQGDEQDASGQDEEQQDTGALEGGPQDGQDQQQDPAAHPPGAQGGEQDEDEGQDASSGAGGGGGGGSLDAGLLQSLPTGPQLDAAPAYAPQGDSIGAHMVQNGPASNPSADAADSLLDAAWGLTTDAFGPLVAYDKDNGGFAFENLWGVSKQVDAIFQAATAERGDSSLDNATEIISTLAQVASSIGSVAGAISTTTGLLSLIGLIPPLAPVGAALLSISGITRQIAAYSGLAATILSAVTTVLSAIQVVNAVKSGAPDARARFELYQADVGTFVGNGIGTLFDAASGGFKPTSPDVKVLNKTFKKNADAEKLLKQAAKTPGSTGRSLAYKANKMVGDAVSWQTKGSTKQLYMNTAKELIGQQSEQLVKQTSKQVTKNLASTAFDGVPRKLMETGLKNANTAATASQSDQGGQASLPTPQHSPVELDQITQARQEISQALGHVQSVGDQGQAAAMGGEVLLQTAQDHQTQAAELQAGLGTQQAGLEGFAQQAVEGQAQADQGQQQTGNLGGETQGLKSEAESKQALANQPLPKVDKPKGLLDRAKAWFMEKVVGKVQAGMAWLQDKIASLILNLVAGAMGVDDLDALMAESGLQMSAAEEDVGAAQLSSEQVGADLGVMQDQASTASTDAQAAISQGQEAQAQSADLEQQLLATDAQLQAEEDAIVAYIDGFLQQTGGDSPTQDDLGSTQQQDASETSSVSPKPRGHTPRDVEASPPVSSGRPLSRDEAAPFIERLGPAVGEVMIHTDAEAAAYAASINAEAVTVGRDIYFASGMYRPGTPAGDSLLAHELHHAVQGGGGPGVSQPSDSHEREADSFAAGNASPAPASGGAGGASVSRKPAGPAPTSQQKTPDTTSTQGAQLTPEKIVQLVEQGASQAEIEALMKQGSDSQKNESGAQGAQAGTSDQQSSGEQSGSQGPAPITQGQGGPGGEGEQQGEGEAQGEGEQEAQGEGEQEGAGAGQEGGQEESAAGGEQAPEIPADAMQTLAPAADSLESLPTGDLELIAYELAEHQAWAEAGDAVGEAGSVERLAFIAENVGAGLAVGAATGFAMGAVSGVVGKLAARYCPIPGVGAILAGGMSAYSLLTKDWDAAGETIAAFGTGSSNYEMLANSIASVSEIVDIVQNILNVIAGVIGVISAVMWLVTILTAGVASPLAATLSSIALGIVAAAQILDNINKAVLQPAVLLFRALHTFTDDADPREVEAQGTGLYMAANNVGNAVGAAAGAKVGSAAGDRIADRIDQPRVQQGVDARRAADADSGSRQSSDGPNRVVDDAGPTRAVDDGPSTRAQDADVDTSTRAADGPDNARIAADADAQRTTGWQAVRQEFQAHRQKFIDIAVDRQIAIEDATAAASSAKSQEIETQRQARHDEVDADKAARDADIESTREGVEQSAQRAADDHRLVDQDAAVKQRGADIDAAIEKSNLESTKAQSDYDTRQADIDRDYIDKRLIEMEVWRRVESESNGAVDPIQRDLHDGYLRDLEMQYNRDCATNSGQLADDLSQSSTSYNQAIDQANSAYDSRLSAADQTWNDTVQSARDGLDAQHADVDAWAKQQKDLADAQAAGRQGEVGRAGEDAGVTAQTAADEVYQSEAERIGGPYNLSEGVKEVIKPATEIPRDALAPSGQTGPYAADNATAPQRPESAEMFEVVNTERVNPNYADPPGTLEELGRLEGEIDAILADRQQAASAEQVMTQEQAVVEGQQPAADELVRVSEETIGVGEQQQQQVSERQGANQEQQQRQQETEGMVGSYGDQASGLSVIKTPLAAFQGFTWIASKLPGSAGAAMADINADANEIAAAFDSMDSTMASQTEAQPEIQAGLQADSERLTATQEQAGQSTTTLQDAAVDAQSTADTNAEKVAEASAAREEAATEGAQLDQQATERQGQRDSLASQLTSWAVAHRAARQAAIQQQDKNTED